jgi:hypothetical protein
MDTITVKEFIKQLKRYPEDMEVYGTWEGQIVPIYDIEPDRIEKGWGFGRLPEEQDFVLISVEYVDPKKAYMNKEQENDSSQ